WISAISVPFYAVVVFAHDARRVLARLDRDGLVDDAFLFGVVAHFDVTGNRAVLAEGVADEAVIRQDAAQVGVALGDDAVQVKGLAFVPVDRWPDAHQRGDHRKGVVGRIGAHAQAPVMGHRQQVDHHGEALGMGGVGRVVGGGFPAGTTDPAPVHTGSKPQVGGSAQRAT